MILSTHYQKITSLVLFIGLLCFFSGFFWQSSYSRLHTVYFILVVLPALLLIPVFIKEQLHHNTLFLIIIAFCGYSLLAVFWGNNVYPSLIFQYIKRIATLIILFYAVYHTLLHYPKSETLFFILSIGCAVVLFAYSLVGYIQEGFSGRLTLWGGLNDMIASASVYGVLFILLIRAYLLETNKYKLFIYLLLALFFALEILLTKSRGVQLALLLSTPFIFLFVKPVSRQRVYYPLMIISIIGVAIFIFSDLFSIIFSRGFDLSSRDIIWQKSIAWSLQKPWFGYGLGTPFRFDLPNIGLNVSHSHNIILATWLYTGVLGVILLLIILYFAFRQCLINKQEEYSIFAVVLLFGLLCLLTNGSYPISRANERWFIFWIPLAFIVAHSFIKEQRSLTLTEKEVEKK